MSSTMTMDNATTERCRGLESHVNGFSMVKPLVVSGNVWLAKPDIATFSNWMHDPRHDVADPNKQAAMLQAFK